MYPTVNNGCYLSTPLVNREDLDTRYGYLKACHQRMNCHSECIKQPLKIFNYHTLFMIISQHVRNLRGVWFFVSMII